MCLKMSVTVIPEYLHKAFDIRESLVVHDNAAFQALPALLFAIRARQAFLAFSAKMYAIWVINERTRVPPSLSTRGAAPMPFFLLENTQNGSPFVIRDVFMCFRLENHGLLLLFCPLLVSRFEKSQKSDERRRNVFLSSASSVLFFFSFFFVSSSSISPFAALVEAKKSLMTLERKVFNGNVYSTRTKTERRRSLLLERWCRTM